MDAGVLHGAACTGCTSRLPRVKLSTFAVSSFGGGADTVSVLSSPPPVSCAACTSLCCAVCGETLGAAGSDPEIAAGVHWGGCTGRGLASLAVAVSAVRNAVNRTSRRRVKEDGSVVTDEESGDEGGGSATKARHARSYGDGGTGYAGDRDGDEGRLRQAAKSAAALEERNAQTLLAAFSQLTHATPAALEGAEAADATAAVRAATAGAGASPSAPGTSDTILQVLLWDGTPDTWDALAEQMAPAGAEAPTAAGGGPVSAVPTSLPPKGGAAAAAAAAPASSASAGPSAFFAACSSVLRTSLLDTSSSSNAKKSLFRAVVALLATVAQAPAVSHALVYKPGGEAAAAAAAAPAGAAGAAAGGGGGSPAAAATAAPLGGVKWVPPAATGATLSTGVRGAAAAEGAGAPVPAPPKGSLADLLSTLAGQADIFLATHERLGSGSSAGAGSAGGGGSDASYEAQLVIASCIQSAWSAARDALRRWADSTRSADGSGLAGRRRRARGGPGEEGVPSELEVYSKLEEEVYAQGGLGGVWIALSDPIDAHNAGRGTFSYEPPPALAAAYCELMQEEAFYEHEDLAKSHIALVGHTYLPSSTSKSATLPIKAARRVCTELAGLKDLCVNWAQTVLARNDPARIDCVKMVLTGPPDTPYQNGVFTFDMWIPPTYPSGPPTLVITNTAGGKFRFNPNLYSDGKVCLSLLGTWDGPGWVAPDDKGGGSTLAQVAMSVTSLILCAVPMANEPGHEGCLSSHHGRLEVAAHNMLLRIGTLRHAMVEMLTSPPEGFERAVQSHFWYKRPELVVQLEAWTAEAASLAQYEAYLAARQALLSGKEMARVRALAAAGGASTDAAGGRADAPIFLDQATPAAVQAAVEATAAADGGAEGTPAPAPAASVAAGGGGPAPASAGSMIVPSLLREFSRRSGGKPFAARAAALQAEASRMASARSSYSSAVSSMQSWVGDGSTGTPKGDVDPEGLELPPEAVGAVWGDEALKEECRARTGKARKARADAAAEAGGAAAAGGGGGADSSSRRRARMAGRSWAQVAAATKEAAQQLLSLLAAMPRPEDIPSPAAS